MTSIGSGVLMRSVGLLRSTPFRIGLGLFVLFLFSGMTLLISIYAATSGHLVEKAEEEISEETDLLVETFHQGGMQALAGRIQRRLDRRPAGSAIYLLLDPAGTAVTGNLDRRPAAIPEDGWVRFPLEFEESPGRAHSARARIVDLPGGSVLLVGRDMYELQAVRRLIVAPLAWGAGLTAGIALLVAVLAGRRRVRRITAVNRVLGEIMSGDLSRRLPSSGRDDDVDRVVMNINHMLDAIEVLVEDVGRVSDNIAHDLRTPLARLRNRLESLRAAADGSPSLEEEADGALRSADALLKTFNALLRIARVESGQWSSGIEPVDLGTILTDVVEFYAPLAEERGQRIDLRIEEKAIVPGDRDLLFQALANLLDNAIKHTPAAGRIEASLGRTATHVEVSIADSGPGVPEEDRDRVFRRFYRLSSSRSTPGNGLGLSLVAAVARLHSGRVHVEDNSPGARFVLEIPLKAPSSTLVPGRGSGT